jgi:hypothetical protein
MTCSPYWNGLSKPPSVTMMICDKCCGEDLRESREIAAIIRGYRGESAFLQDLASYCFNRQACLQMG